ncbi:MAG: SIMPL domain-containing protein [Spirochaetales bacterium]|nr:SIMPL domain-containing protein [Spirochaetales bacterium]
MKKLLITPILLLALFSCAVAEKGEIEATGYAEKIVTPDMIEVNLSISSTEKNRNDSVAKVSAETSRIIAIFKSFGIADEDVNSGIVRTDKEYRWINNTNTLVGFRTTQSFLLKLKDISQFEKLSEQLLANDITDITNINFTHSKLKELQREANILALQEARATAEANAAALGVDIGKIKQVKTSTNNYQPMPKRALTAKYEALSDSSTGGLQVAPGLISIPGTAYIVFTIEQ